MSRYFVCMPGIDGDGSARTVDGTEYFPIQCSSMQHGIDLPVVAKGASRTPGYSMHGSVVFRHELDKATPKLRQEAALGTKVGKVAIIRTEMEDGVSVDAETIRLGKVRVASVDMETPVKGNGSEPGDLPYELFALDYQEIVWEWRYKPEGGTASAIDGGWDTDDQATLTAIPVDPDP